MMNPTVLPGTSSGTGPSAPAYDDAELRGRVVEAEDEIADLKTGKATSASVTAVRERMDELTTTGTRHVLAADVPLAVTANANGGFLNIQFACVPEGADPYGAAFFVNVVGGLLDVDDLYDQIASSLSTSYASATAEISRDENGVVSFTAIDIGVPMSVTYDVFGGDLALAGLPTGEADGTPYGTLKRIEAQATRYAVDLPAEARIVLPFGFDATTPVTRLDIQPGETFSLESFVDNVSIGPGVQIVVPVGSLYDMLAAVQAAAPGFGYTASTATGGRTVLSVVAPTAGLTSFFLQGEPIRKMCGRLTVYGDRLRGAASAGNIVFGMDGTNLYQVVDELWNANAALRADAADLDALLYGTAVPRGLSPQRTFRGRGFPQGTTPDTTLSELGLGVVHTLTLLIFYSPTVSVPQAMLTLQPSTTLAQVATMLRDGNVGRVELGPTDGSAPMRLSIANLADAMYSVAPDEASFALRLADRASLGILARLGGIDGAA